MPAPLIPTGPTTDAEGHLASLLEADSYPCLTGEEVTALLLRHQTALLWSPGTAYAVGDRVQVNPAEGVLSWGWLTGLLEDARFGVYFRAVQGGVSGDAEPAWAYAEIAYGRLYGVSDGGVLWRYDGLAAKDRFDFQSAAYEGWMKKAGKVAGDYDFARADQKLSRSQVIEHCKSMAASFSGGSFFVV